jgi:hypothetical protein
MITFHPMTAGGWLRVWALGGVAIVLTIHVLFPRQEPTSPLPDLEPARWCARAFRTFGVSASDSLALLVLRPECVSVMAERRKARAQYEGIAAEAPEGWRRRP